MKFIGFRFELKNPFTIVGVKERADYKSEIWIPVIKK